MSPRCEASEENGAHKLKYRGFIGIKESLSEVLTFRFWRDCVCEMFVTFFMVFYGLIITISFPGNPTNGPLIAFAGGFIVFVLIEAFGHIQLAVMNPVATMVFVTTKRLGFIKGIVFLVFQLGGSVAATKVVFAVTPPELRDSIRPIGLGPGVSVWGGLGVEVVLTALLAFVIQGSLDHDRKKVRMGGLPIGVAVGLGILVGERYTGGCMNPVIPFGAAAITGIWDYHWIYWAGDLFGGSLAILLYVLFTYEGWPFDTKESTTSPEDDECQTKMLPKAENGDTVVLRKRKNDTSNI